MVLLLFEEGMVQHLKYTFLVFPEKQHHHLKHFWIFPLKCFTKVFHQLLRFSKRLRDVDFWVCISVHPWLGRNPEQVNLAAMHLILTDLLGPAYLILWWRKLKTCPWIQTWDLKIAVPLFLSMNCLQGWKENNYLYSVLIIYPPQWVHHVA